MIGNDTDRGSTFVMPTTVALAFGASKDPSRPVTPRGAWRSAAWGLGRRFLADSRGNTAMEYTLIAGLVFLAIVGALRTFADQTQAMYNFIGTKVGQTP